MRSFAALLLAVTTAFVLVSSSALAMIDVEGNSATFAWTPSSGPVALYAVQLARNHEGFTDTIASYVVEPQVTVYGEFGETIRVRVAAWGVDASANAYFSSDPSPASELVRFVDPAGGGVPPAPTPPPPSPGPTPPPPSPGPTPPLTTGTMPYDFDGDGRTDLLWRNKQTNALAVWSMNGTSPPTIVDLGTLNLDWVFVGSGDFDGDGRADLLARTDRVYAIWFVKGEELLRTTPYMSHGRGTFVEAIGDFDGNGYGDLLWTWAETHTHVTLMRDGRVVRSVLGPLTRGSYSPGTCTPDVNGDGMSDQVRSDSYGTYVWLMDGTTVVRSGTAGPQMPNAQVIGCGDADGDGFGDLLWYDSNSRQGTLWRMDGDVRLDRSFELPQLEAGWTMEAAGDFDGDGRANDILVRNETSGRIEVWVLQWNGQLTGFSVLSTGSRAGMGNADWEVVAP